jgi:hypothetical protein
MRAWDRSIGAAVVSLALSVGAFAQGAGAASPAQRDAQVEAITREADRLAREAGALMAAGRTAEANAKYAQAAAKQREAAELMEKAAQDLLQQPGGTPAAPAPGRAPATTPGTIRGTVGGTVGGAPAPAHARPAAPAPAPPAAGQGSDRCPVGQQVVDMLKKTGVITRAVDAVDCEVQYPDGKKATLLFWMLKPTTGAPAPPPNRCPVGQRVADQLDKTGVIVRAVDEVTCEVKYADGHAERLLFWMLRPAGTPAVDPTARAAGPAASRYECWNYGGSPAYSANFEVTGAGRYRDSEGAAAVYAYDGGSGRMSFHGGVLDGEVGVYYPATPTHPSHITLLGPSGNAAEDCHPPGN